MNVATLTAPRSLVVISPRGQREGTLGRGDRVVEQDRARRLQAERGRTAPGQRYGDGDVARLVSRGSGGDDDVGTAQLVHELSGIEIGAIVAGDEDAGFFEGAAGGCCIGDHDVERIEQQRAEGAPGGREVGGAGVGRASPCPTPRPSRRRRRAGRRGRRCGRRRRCARRTRPRRCRRRRRRGRRRQCVVAASTVVVAAWGRLPPPCQSPPMRMVPPPSGALASRVAPASSMAAPVTVMDGRGGGGVIEAGACAGSARGALASRRPETRTRAAVAAAEDDGARAAADAARLDDAGEVDDLAGHLPGGGGLHLDPAAVGGEPAAVADEGRVVAVVVGGHAHLQEAVAGDVEGRALAGAEADLAHARGDGAGVVDLAADQRRVAAPAHLDRALVDDRRGPALALEAAPPGDEVLVGGGQRRGDEGAGLAPCRSG